MVNVRHCCHPLRIKVWGLLSTLVTPGWFSTDEQGDPSFKSKRYQFLHWHRLQEQNTMLEQGVQHYRKKWMMRLYSAEHSKRVHDVLASLHYKSWSKKKWNCVWSIISMLLIHHWKRQWKACLFLVLTMSHLKGWWKKMKTDIWSTKHEVPLFFFL